MNSIILSINENYNFLFVSSNSGYTFHIRIFLAYSDDFFNFTSSSFTFLFTGELSGELIFFLLKLIDN